MNTCCNSYCNRPSVTSHDLCRSPLYENFESQAPSCDSDEELFTKKSGCELFPNAVTSPRNVQMKCIDKEQNYHAFRRLWSQNLGQSGCGKNTLRENLSCKRWPPPIVPVPHGLKIPIEFKLRPESYSCRGWDSQRYVEALPEDAVQEEIWEPRICDKLQEGAKGILNTAESKNFSISPTSICFTNPQIGSKYWMTLKVRNHGKNSRRIAVIGPLNSQLLVEWGATIGEKTTLAPGLTKRIIVTYTPKTSDPLAEVITVVIQGDGAIVVPVRGDSSSMPVLEMEEWDVGCCLVGGSKVTEFQVINRGGVGRFWILSQEEFEEETLNVKERTKHKLEDGATDARISTDIGQASGDSNENVVTDHQEDDGVIKNDSILNVMFKPPFGIYPACYRLQKNQSVKILILFRPDKHVQYIQKLAILCDNKEVRWVTLRGVGVGGGSQVSLKGEWKAPPLDLPCDISPKLVMNCGDLLTGEMHVENFKLKNSSCMDFYYFWVIRPVRSGGGMSSESKHGHSGLQYVPGGFEPVTPPRDPVLSVDLKLEPPFGILHGYTEIEISATVTAPESHGFYGCVLSLFVQQIDIRTKPILDWISANQPVGDTPLALSALAEVLPLKELSMPWRHMHQESKNSAEPNTQTQAIDTNDDKEMHELLEFFKNNPETTDLSRVGAGDVRDVEVEDDGVQAAAGHNENTAPPVVLASDIPFQDTQEFYYIQFVEGASDDVGRWRLANAMSAENSAVGSTGVEKSESNFYKVNFGSRKFSGKVKFERCAIKIGDNGVGDEVYEANVMHRTFVEEIEPDMYGEDSNEATYNDTSTWRSELLKTVTKECSDFTGRINEAMKWLDSSSPLQPFTELEFWLQSVPLQCVFDPTCISARGRFSETITRHVAFVNFSKHTLQLSMGHVVTSVGSIICRPYEVLVAPRQLVQLNFVFSFRGHGCVRGQLCGEISMPFMKIPCGIPYTISSEGPQVRTLTTVIDFGLVEPGEYAEALVISNTGTFRTKWRASWTNVFKGLKGKCSSNSLRLWPESGWVEGNETVGIQVYLCAGAEGSVRSNIEVVVEENAESTFLVPVVAEIQSPKVFLLKSRLNLPDLFVNHVDVSGKTVLVNSGNMETRFKWMHPVGDCAQYCSLTVQPAEGVLSPQTSMECTFEFSAKKSLELENLFVPCCIKGNREPLLVKIEGTVYLLKIRVSIPPTALHLLSAGRLSRRCRHLLENLCGLADERPGEIEEYVNEITFYGNYCKILCSTPAPPPSTRETAEDGNEYVNVPENSPSLFNDDQPVDWNEKPFNEEATGEGGSTKASRELIKPPSVLVSKGKQIYLQVSSPEDIAIAEFTITNDSPYKVNFEACIVNNEAASRWVDAETDFLPLNDRFFGSVKASSEHEDYFYIADGAFFKVTPSLGTLESNVSLKFTLQFRSTRCGIFDDKVKIFFQGMQNPYFINVEGLAVVGGAATSDLAVPEEEAITRL